MMTHEEFLSNLPKSPEMKPDSKAFVIDLPAPPSYNDCLDLSWRRIQRSSKYTKWIRAVRDHIGDEVKEQLTNGLQDKMNNQMLFAALIAFLHGRRDTDNVYKPTLDVLETERSKKSGEVLRRGVYENDRQVEFLHIYRKRIPNHEPERILVWVQPLGGPKTKKRMARQRVIDFQ